METWVDSLFFCKFTKQGIHALFGASVYRFHEKNDVTREAPVRLVGFPLGDSRPWLISRASTCWSIGAHVWRERYAVKRYALKIANLSTPVTIFPTEYSWLIGEVGTVFCWGVGGQILGELYYLLPGGGGGVPGICLWGVQEGGGVFFSRLRRDFLYFPYKKNFRAFGAISHVHTP